eukprot:49335-Prorocentrum_minimum.AAC.1
MERITLTLPPLGASVTSTFRSRSRPVMLPPRTVFMKCLANVPRTVLFARDFIKTVCKGSMAGRDRDLNVEVTDPPMGGMVNVILSIKPTSEAVKAAQKVGGAPSAGEVRQQ